MHQSPHLAAQASESLIWRLEQSCKFFQAVADGGKGSDSDV